MNKILQNPKSVKTWLLIQTIIPLLACVITIYEINTSLFICSLVLAINIVISLIYSFLLSKELKSIFWKIIIIVAAILPVIYFELYCGLWMLVAFLIRGFIGCYLINDCPLGSLY